jgi:NitT/TauT family transport system substrate-binding protein
MLIRFVRIRRAVAATAVLALVAAACGGDDDDAAPEAGSTPEAATSAAESAAPDGDATPLRLGYFPNVTHAPAVLGVETGLLQEALGGSVDLELQTFNSGTEVIEGIFSDALDASFIGPNPAINGYARSGGEALRIVSGTTSGRA